MKWVSVGIATLLFNLNPLILIILAGLLLKEYVAKIDIVAVLGSLLGVYLISDLTGGLDQSTIGMLLAILSAMCAACTYIALRSLNTASNLHYLVSPFWVSIYGIFLSLVIQLLFPQWIHATSYT